MCLLRPARAEPQPPRSPEASRPLSRLLAVLIPHLSRVKPALEVHYKTPRVASIPQSLMSSYVAIARRTCSSSRRRMCRTRLRRQPNLAFNWYRVTRTVSSGLVEGLSGVEKLAARKPFGFRTAKRIDTALFHAMGRAAAGFIPRILLMGLISESQA